MNPFIKSYSLKHLKEAFQKTYSLNHQYICVTGRGNLLSQFSLYRSAEDQQQIHNDIDHLIQQEYMEQSSAPRWAIRVSRESTHSGESPLFINKLLAPNKVRTTYNMLIYI